MQRFGATGNSGIQTTCKGSNIIRSIADRNRAGIRKRDVIGDRNVFIEHNTVVLVLRRQRRQ